MSAPTARELRDFIRESMETPTEELDGLAEALADWLASRKVEAAPSDTDREALKRVAEVASGDHITESVAEYRAATSPDSEPTDWELEFWHAGYRRGALAIIDYLALSQPVQVEVSEHKITQRMPWPPCPESSYLLSLFECSCGWTTNTFRDTLKNRAIIEDYRRLADFHAAALGGGE